MKWFKKKQPMMEPIQGPPGPLDISTAGRMKDAGDVDGLLRALGNPTTPEEAKTAEHAAAALADLKEPRARAGLLAVMKLSPYPLSRERALRALGDIGDESCVEPILEFLEPNVRTFRDMLRLVRSGDLSTVPNLADDLSKAVSAARVAISTIEALGKLRDARAFAPVSAVLNDVTIRDTAESPRKPARGGLFDVERYIGALPEMAARVRAAAADALRRIPKPKGAPAPAPQEAAARGGVGVAEAGDVMRLLMSQQAPCRKCGTAVVFQEGGLLAMEAGIRDQVVMCKKCRSIYEVNLSPRGLQLLDDVTARYEST